MLKRNINFGIVITTIALVFILNNTFGLNIIENMEWKKIWPIFLLLWGVSLIIRQSEK